MMFLLHETEYNLHSESTGKSSLGYVKCALPFYNLNTDTEGILVFCIKIMDYFISYILGG